MKSLKKLTSLILAFMLLVSVMTVGASAVTVNDAATGATTVYLVPGSEWNKDGAWFAAYSWDGAGSEEWVALADADSDGYYEGTVNYTNVIFCRMGNTSNTLSWDNKWNQTNDLTISGTNNCFTITDPWNTGNTGSWSTYNSPTPTTPSESTPTQDTTPTQPSSSQSTGNAAYYLIGQFDGVDVGDGADYASTGYPMTDGQATVTVQDTAYVCVKNGNSQWYMTNDWLGFDTTTATLYSTADTSITKFDKLYVPAGTYTFTVAENADGTLTLSYAPSGSPEPPESSEATQPTTPSQSEPTPTTPSVTTTYDAWSVNVVAGSNMSTETATQKIGDWDGPFAVTYKLTADQLIADGQFEIVYNSQQLTVENIEFPVVTSGLTYNTSASANMIAFNFTGISETTHKGIYDFTNGGVLVTVYFSLNKTLVEYTTNVTLNCLELDSVDKAYYTEGVATATGAALQGAIVKETDVPVVTVPTAPTTPSQSEPTPTTPQPTTPQPTTPQPTTPQPTTPQPTTPQPTTPQPTTPQPTTPQPTQPAKKPYLNITSAKVKAGATVKLEVKDNNTGAKPKFSVDDKEIVKVSAKGKVTALKKGTAMITATVGSTKLTCKVKVTTNPKLTNTSGKKISKVTIGVGGKATKILISGKAAKLKNQYKSTAYVKVSGGKQKPFIKIKGLKAGQSTLEIKVNTSKTLKLKVTVK